MWLREMKRFFRAKSRVISTIAFPLFFLAFLGSGFSQARFPGLPENLQYIDYLAPGIIGMAMIFTSTLSGVSLLMDREFGFLKEIMVTPASRVSIILGRTLGGITTSLFQGIAILVISMFLGVKYQSFFGIFMAVVFMILISCTFIGMGLSIASVMKDVQGFQLIVQFVIFPLFFLSGALYPIENLPSFIRFLTYLDPLTYGVDGLRGSLIGINEFPMALNFFVLVGACIFMITLGAWLFKRSEA